MDVTLTPKRSRGAAPARLDGWKSIGAYFDRDRSTVIRWARERGLPVRRFPGGKVATVYALREELDRWAGLFSPDEAPSVATPLATVGLGWNLGSIPALDQQLGDLAHSRADIPFGDCGIDPQSDVRGRAFTARPTR